MPPTRKMIQSVSDARPLIESGQEFCIVTESDEYPGELLFLHAEQVRFVEEHRDFLSSYCLLNELFMLEHFLAKLADEGVEVLFLPSAKPILDKFDDWNRPIQVQGLDLPNGLHPFQQFGLRRSFDSMLGSRKKARGFFFNFGTGTGKSIVAAAGVQELLVNRGEVDLVLMFTTSRMRFNLARAVGGTTETTPVVPDGTKERRSRQYGEYPRVVVLNYEKAHFDYDEVEHLIAGQRVLWVFDEVQKILHGTNKKNLSRKAIDRLMKTTKKSLVWPMSASVVKSSPFRYHDTFQVVAPRHNPLGTRKDFEDKYCESVREHRLPTGATVKFYDWDLLGLTEVRHRVSEFTMAVRKTDPGVREFFKGIQTIVVPVQPSRDEVKLYEAILADAEESEDEITAQHYLALRAVCNTPAALIGSESAVAERILAKHGKLVKAPSSKLEAIVDKIDEIKEQGDQVVVFSQWTRMGILPLGRLLEKAGIKYVLHHGGMSAKAAQAAQDDFKADPEITVFLSSDAGSTGLNFQNARYVINIECPYDPDTLMQRNDRIDRADSHLNGLTVYVYLCEGTIEEDVWAINQKRRAISETVQGTTEALSRYSAEELQSMMSMTEQQAASMILGRRIQPK